MDVAMVFAVLGGFLAGAYLAYKSEAAGSGSKPFRLPVVGADAWDDDLSSSGSFLNVGVRLNPLSVTSSFITDCTTDSLLSI